MNVETFPDVLEAIAKLVRDDAAISAMVGHRVATDILPTGWPSPAVVLHVVSEVAEDTITGPLGTDDARIQIDCHGNSRGEANKLRQLVRKRIGGFRGVSAGAFIKSVSQATGHHNQTDRPVAGGEAFRFTSIQDFSVFYDSTSIY